MANRKPLRQSLRLCALLCALMAGVYLLSYRAVIQSGDTLRAFDAVTSLARYGDWLMDESAWTGLALRIRAADKLPLAQYDVEERLQARLALPLLQLAQTVPRLGNIHAVWLFNIIVGALIVGLMYLLLRALRYSDAVAVIVSLSAGLATNLWAYSQTFFREPLTALLILAALLCLQVGCKRALRPRIISWLLAAALLLLAVQVKYSAAFAIPAALYFAIPESADSPRRLRKLSRLLLALLVIALGLAMLFDPLPQTLLAALAQIGLDGSYVAAALRAYLLSPGASLWGSSPLALLAIAGCMALLARGRYRLATAICLLAAAYALGHALLSGRHWFGGLSFPPRFLTPVLPILMLGCAPIVERMLAKRHRALAALWIALLLYGIWIQFSAVSLSWRHYGESLPAESGGLAEWTPSLFQPQYFRWAIAPQRWADLGLDFLWTRADLPVWGISFGVYALAIGACLWRTLRKPGDRWRHAALPLVFLCLPLTLLNLSAAYQRDPRSRSQDAALREALDYVAHHASQDDILLLGSDDYAEFVMNHLDSAKPRPVILPRPLAQAASDKQPALVRSSNPNDFFDVRSVRAINHLMAKQDRLWLLAETSPFMPWSYRPLERYLALHAYPLREVALERSDPSARLLEYSARSSPPSPFAPFSGDMATELRYGEHMRLAHITLSNGNRYRAGESIEVSLHWHTESPLAHDYSIALFAAQSSSQQVIAQGHDSAPQAGFAPTSSWQPYQPIIDNRALRLPDDAPVGDIELWLAIYRFDSAIGDIARLPVTGGESVHLGEIGVLPARLIVEPAAEEGN